MGETGSSAPPGGSAPPPTPAPLPATAALTAALSVLRRSAPGAGGRRTMVGLIAVAALSTVYVLWPFRTPLFLAAVLAGALQPLLVRAERLCGGRRRLAGGLVALLLFAVIVAPFASLVAFAVRETEAGLAWVRDELGVQSVGDFSFARLPQPAQVLLEKAMVWLHLSHEQVRAAAGEALGVAQRVGPALLGASFGAVAGTVLMVVAFYFLLLDGRSAVRFLSGLSPLQAFQTQELLQEFSNVTSAALMGGALTAVVQGALATSAYLITGVPHAFFLGIATLVASFIPVVGTALIWVPAVVLLALTKHVTAAIVLGVFCGVVVTLADNVVKPWVMRGKVEMHTGLVFLSLLGGIASFGLLGVIVGPLIVAFLLAVLRIYHRDFHSGD